MEASVADGELDRELEDELMKYTKKDDHKVEADLFMKSNEVQMNSELEVDITECTKSMNNGLVTAEYEDTTENSSSFDDCNSGDENVDTFGNSEALSSFRADAAPAMDFDGIDERFKMRRKKLTPHWSSFIQPLRWRCKWVELQMKKLQSQAQLYDRQLEAYNEKKLNQLDDSMEGGTRSLPFSQKNVKIVVFKRRKRRRTESTTDITEYMSHHNLFSYYEDRKCFPEGNFMKNDLKNLGNQKMATENEMLGDELMSFELGVDDDYVAETLSKIDFLQSEVGKLKGKLDSIKMENADRLSFAENLDLSPPHDEPGIEGACMESQSTGIVSHTGATSCVDVPVTSGSVGPACFEAYRSVEDGVLIDNQRVKEEMNSFEEVKIQQMPLALNDGSADSTPPVKTEPDLADDRTPAKVRSIAKITGLRSKRKRGRKKGSAGRRGRKSTG